MSRYELIKKYLKTARQPPNTIHIDTSTWKEMKWFTTATVSQKSRIKCFLLNLDKAKRVDLNSDRRKNIFHGINQIMESLCLKIEQLDPRYEGRLIPMGSAHNNMKMGDSDEFDFVYELGMSVTYMGKASSPFFPEDNSIHVVVDEHRFNEPVTGLDYSHENIEAAYCDIGGYNTDDSDLDTTFQGDKIAAKFLGYNSESDSSQEEYEIGRYGAVELDKRSFCDGFHMDLGLSMAHIVDKAMLRLELPRGWGHGGFNRPQYSGLRKSGPALMLQFDYLGTGDQIPLRISVDFVPLSTLSLSVLEAGRMDVLNEFLLKKGFLTQFWASFVTDNLMYFSQGEEEWLRQLSADSVAKTAVRCCKALLSLVSQSAPKCPSRSTVLEIVEYLTQKAQGNRNAELPDIPAASMLSKTEDKKIPIAINDDLVTYLDLGEAGGHFEYLKSYMFKRTVMTLMALEDDEGHNWTDDDLPDLVMSVYMIINDLVKPVQSPLYKSHRDEEEFRTEKLSVPLAGLYRTSDQSSAGSTMENSKSQDKEQIGDSNATPPRFYSMLSSALKECKCMSLVELSSHILGQGMFLRYGRKYAGCPQVCQLLQSVCEGKETAEIDVYIPAVHESEQDDHRFHEEYMTKSEFEKMLTEIHSTEGGANLCDYVRQLDTNAENFHGMHLNESAVQKHASSQKPAAGRAKSRHWKRYGKPRTRTQEPNVVTDQSPKTTFGKSKPQHVHDRDQALNCEIDAGQVKHHQPKEITGRIKELHPKTTAWHNRRLQSDTAEDSKVTLAKPLDLRSKRAAGRSKLHDPKRDTTK